MMNNFCSLPLIWVDTAMQIAVSILSPVSIQKFMPAPLSEEIVSRMLSWSLSSTPVMPMNYTLRSICSITSFYLLYLLTRRAFALS